MQWRCTPHWFKKSESWIFVSYNDQNQHWVYNVMDSEIYSSVFNSRAVRALYIVVLCPRKTVSFGLTWSLSDHFVHRTSPPDIFCSIHASSRTSRKLRNIALEAGHLKVWNEGFVVYCTDWKYSTSIWAPSRFQRWHSLTSLEICWPTRNNKF